MRWALASVLFVALLFVGAIGWITTTLFADEIASALTTPSNLDTIGVYAGRYQRNLDTLTLGLNVAWVIYFLVLIIWYALDSLRREPEVYVPYE